MIAFPVKAVLRNKATVILRGISKIGLEFVQEEYIVGHVETGHDKYQAELSSLEMWRRKDGRWSYSGATNSLDIVGFINPNGTLRPLTSEFQ